MKLTPKQAAERAGISPSLVYDWCATRRLRHARAGRAGRRGKILIEEGDLEAFLRALVVEAGDRPPPPEPLKHIRLG